MTYEDEAAELRGAHVPAGPAPVRTVPDPADVPPRVAAAVAANVRRRLDRNAEELRAAGWVVMSPEELERMPRDEYGCILAQIDPPR